MIRLIRRILPCLLALALLLPGNARAVESPVELSEEPPEEPLEERPAEDLEISAASAIVIEADTGTILYERMPDIRMLIASTTKIMTALVILESCALDETVTITEAQAEVEGSSMELEAGEIYTVEELLYGLMLSSGNDAATALAEYCAGSMDAFADLMNRKAAEIGLRNTHFRNAHGLDAEGHYSCARDLALLTAEAMKNPEFCRFFSTRQQTVHERELYNHNQLLWKLDGCIGGKTGYTNAAGRILVSVTEREGMRLICVTLCAPDDWNDHMALMETLFSQWRLVRLPQDRWDRVEALSGTRDYVRLRCAVPALVIPKDGELTWKLRLPRFVFAPVLLGERAGSVELFQDGEPLQTVEVVYAETVSRAPSVALSAWERFQRSWLMPGRTYEWTK